MTSAAHYTYLPPLNQLFKGPVPFFFLKGIDFLSDPESNQVSGVSGRLTATCRLSGAIRELPRHHIADNKAAVQGTWIPPCPLPGLGQGRFFGNVDGFARGTQDGAGDPSA